MNTDTGDIYRTDEEIAKAKERGEPLAVVSNFVAAAVTVGKKEIAKQTAKRKRKMARQSRKRNR